MRKVGVIASVGLLLLVTPFLALASSSSASSTSSSKNFMTPVSASFYINGFPDDGIYNFSVSPGSQVSLNVTATYPWAAFPSAGTFTITYSLNPFPLSSAIPAWLEPFVSPPSSTLVRGIASSAVLQIGLGDMITDGGRGSFALHATYVDPISNRQIVHVIVINVTASSSPGPILVSRVMAENSGPSVSPSTSSWALGAGLCDSSTTSSCSGGGISWKTVVGISTWLTVPTGFTDSSTTYITLNGIPAPGGGWFFQMTLLAPSSGTTWQETVWVMGPNGYGCNFSPDSTTSGSSWTMVILYNSFYGIWYASDPNGSWQISSYCSVPSGSSFYSIDQEPFAFESYDLTYSHFTSLFLDATPVFQYEVSGTWYNPPGAYVVNANDASSWDGWAVGGGSATPSQVLEGGHLQCSSLNTYELNLGYYTSVSCGTNTFGTKLMK